MTEKNRKILFDADSEETIEITLTEEDGSEVEAEFLAHIEVEEWGKEYIAVVPKNTDGMEEVEATVFEYQEDADGNPVFCEIESDEERETVADLFNQCLAEEEDKDEDDDDYLGDLSSFVPGVSVKK